METIVQDIRYALRVLRKSPAFSTVAVLTLALGIGANTAIFSLVNAVLLKSLPVEAPQQLAAVGDPTRVHSRSSGTPQMDLFSVPLYRELSAGNSIFTGLMASGENNGLQVKGTSSDEITKTATGVLVSGNYFSVLGVKAFMGRVLASEDDGAPGANPVAVVSYAFWRDKLGRDENVIGRVLRLNNYPFNVVGVAAPGFFGDTVGDSQDIWVPLSMQEQVITGRSWLKNPSVSWLLTLGRLKPGVTLEQAQANVNVLLQQIVNGPYGATLSNDDRDEVKKSKIEVTAGGAGFSELRGEMRRPLLLLMMIVGLVLLIAAVNVANLLLARATARRKEFAVRVAIGASSARIVRQLLTESVMLSIAGGALGLLMAHWGARALLSVTRNSQLQAAIDLKVLFFTATVCIATGILFGLVPAVRSRKSSVAPVLKSGAQAGDRPPKTGFTFGQGLVSAQVAVSLLVLFAAGLLVRTMQNLRHLDLGYERGHLLIVSTDPLSARLNHDRTIDFSNQMVRDFRALPGVRAASYSINGLFSGSESGETIEVPGYARKTDGEMEAAFDRIGPDYFAAVGIPILVGRGVGEQDTASSPKVAVINETMSKFYFGKLDPVGRTFLKPDGKGNKETLQIIGVAKDVRDHELRNSVKRRFYVPLAQETDPVPVINFEIRAGGNPSTIGEAARKAVTAYNADIAVRSVRSLDESVARAMSSEVMIAKLSGFFAILALLLACIGLYGVLSYSVAGQTREIGVRMALGAQRSDVLAMVLREAMKLVAGGVIVGVPLALMSSHWLSAMLYGLSSMDPVSLGLVVVLLGFVALLASSIPARRATRVDPMVTLRYE